MLRQQISLAHKKQFAKRYIIIRERSLEHVDRYDLALLQIHLARLRCL